VPFTRATNAPGYCTTEALTAEAAPHTSGEYIYLTLDREEEVLVVRMVV